MDALHNHALQLWGTLRANDCSLSMQLLKFIVQEISVVSIIMKMLARDTLVELSSDISECLPKSERKDLLGLQFFPANEASRPSSLGAGPTGLERCV